MGWGSEGAKGVCNVVSESGTAIADRLHNDSTHANESLVKQPQVMSGYACVTPGDPEPSGPVLQCPASFVVGAPSKFHRLRTTGGFRGGGGCVQQTLGLRVL